MALDKTIQFRADSQEKEHLVEAAKDSGMKLSAYLRTVVLARTVVVVGEQLGVIVIPATDSPTTEDRRIMDAVTAAIAQLNGQAPSPAAGDDSAAVTPPGSAPATSPGEGGLMVGASSVLPQDVPPVGPEPSSASTQAAADSSADRSSGPEETLAGAAALEPAGAAACPDCGGVDGQHQGFCEQLTGEPPVEGTQAPTETPVPEGRKIESHEDFIRRRVGEGENQLIAEAEWRKLTSDQLTGQAQAAQMAACPVCGTTKSTAATCPDCGALPQQ